MSGLKAKNLEQAIVELGLKADSPMIEILAKQFQSDGQETVNKIKKKGFNNLKQVKEQRSSNAQEMLDYKQQFIKSITPMAAKAGAELNVDPKLIITQAALETRYGKAGGNNLFGIKSSHGTPTQTHEEVNGKLVSMQQNFAAYDNRQASFDDYVRLMKTDRYSEALTNGYNPKEYFAAQHKAGYQTDSLAPSKLLSIYNSKNISGLDIGSSSIAKPATSLAMGAGVLNAISGAGKQQTIPALKMTAANDPRITGNSTTPLSSAAKITENTTKNKYDDAANRKNISTLSFQNKVLYYLGRIDKNLVNGIGKDSEGKTVEKVGISSSQNILGSLVTGLMGKGAGAVANGVGTAIGSAVGSLTGRLSAALLAGIKLPMVMPLAGIAVGGAIIGSGVNWEAAIRKETDSFKKRQLIEEKNSNFWSRDVTGLPKLQDLKGSDGKPLISQKTIDTSLPTLGYKAWRRVSEDFDRGSNAIILSGKGKDYLSTTTLELFSSIGNSLKNTGKDIKTSGESFKKSVDTSALGFANSLANALSGFSNTVVDKAKTAGGAVLNGVDTGINTVKKWFTESGDEQKQIPERAFTGKELPDNKLNLVPPASKSIGKKTYTDTVLSLNAASQAAESILLREKDEQKQILSNVGNTTVVNNNNSGGEGSLRLSPRIDPNIHQKSLWQHGVTNQ